MAAKKKSVAPKPLTAKSSPNWIIYTAPWFDSHMDDDMRTVASSFKQIYLDAAKKMRSGQHYFFRNRHSGFPGSDLYGMVKVEIVGIKTKPHSIADLFHVEIVYRADEIAQKVLGVGKYGETVIRGGRVSESSDALCSLHNPAALERMLGQYGNLIAPYGRYFRR